MIGLLVGHGDTVLLLGREGVIFVLGRLGEVDLHQRTSPVKSTFECYLSGGLHMECRVGGEPVCQKRLRLRMRRRPRRLPRRRTPAMDIGLIGRPIMSMNRLAGPVDGVSSPSVTSTA